MLVYSNYAIAVYVMYFTKICITQIIFLHIMALSNSYMQKYANIHIYSHISTYV